MHPFPSTNQPDRHSRPSARARSSTASTPGRRTDTVAPPEATLSLVPRGRIDITDVRDLAAEACDGALRVYPRCLYCSLHTTAGYLPQSLIVRLRPRSRAIDTYVELLRTVFPEHAGYSHDQLA